MLAMYSGSRSDMTWATSSCRANPVRAGRWAVLPSRSKRPVNRAASAAR